MSEFSFITKTIPLSQFAQSYLIKSELEENEPSTDSTCGGILSNTNYAWYANGPRFEVIDLKRGRTVAGWCFGSIVKDSSTKVVCVAEIPTLARDSPVLAIGLEYVLTGGTICIFDVLSSKVLRAIQFHEKIFSLHVIDGGKSLLPLCGPLRSFDGVIGVGCIGGDVLLVDLCQHSIEEEAERDEIDACQIVVLTCRDVSNLEYHKQRLQAGVHLAIHLNSSNSQMPNRRHSPDITVTALYYCPQLGSLLLGYSFGAWELWELGSMTLVYMSPTYDKNVPISHFAIQEPADDPKPVCYIWVVYSHKEACSSYPLAVMYSVNYGIKEFHDGYGILYQDFDACTIRYQMELAPFSQSTSAPSKEANCLRLTSYNRSSSNRYNPLENQEEIFSICYMSWNVYGAGGVESYLSLFDLNQWYKAQMPSSNDDGCGNYLSTICMTDLIENRDFLFDVAIEENSIKQFLGVQKPEEHYFPTSLSFDICCCDEKVVNFIHHQGQQRSLLNNLEKAESLIFMKPLEICQTALQLGLAPSFFDASISSIISQREFLLSLALEQQMISWLCKTANTWSNGRFKSTGCTLEFFLEWAWNRTVVLKTNADTLSTPLFDYSESIIDANNQRIMNFCINQLANMLIIYQYVIKKLDEFILHKDLVHQQCDSLHKVVTHLEVVQWLINIGLLPETGRCYLYPIESLLTNYNQRRSEVQDAYQRRFSSNEHLLFVDNILKNEFCNMTLQEYWREDEGNGLYPPPSLQSLLRTYLIDNVNMAFKHSIVIYAFLDLAMALDRDKDTFIITQLIKFPIIFRLSPSIIKLTQAFWYLDHGDFGPALERLLDPLIPNKDLKIWHHQMILNAFLIQGQHNLALTYYQIRKPCLKDDDDLLKVLSLFAENNMIYEAMDFQRKHVTAENQVQILTHLYRECNSTKQIKKLLRYALTEMEEQILMKYLRDISHPQQEELEAMYYLQRYRYMDIFEMSKSRTSTVPSGLAGQKAMPFKDAFAKSLSGFFPKVSADLFQACKNQKSLLGNKVISRPRPMSVLVHDTEEQAKYKSTLIQIGIEKAREIWNEPVVERSASMMNASAEYFPFVKTPVTPSSSSRKRPLVICPKIIKVVDETDKDTGESPTKKQKLSPRQSTGPLSIQKTNESLNDSNLNMSLSKSTKLDTPIIKRKSRRISGQPLQDGAIATVCTPQSILKVRNLISSHSLLQEDVMSTSLNPSSSPLSSGLKLTPRRSYSRLTVHFEKNSNTLPSTGESEQASRILNLSSILTSSETTTANVQDKSHSKDTSEEVYYSPESSLEEIKEKKSPDADKSNELVLKQSLTVEERNSVSPVKDSRQIKGRTSYKDKTPEKIIEESTSSAKDTSVMFMKPPAVSSPNKLCKPKSRKSLSRMVLENNALSTLSPIVRRSAKLSLTSHGTKPLSSILGEGDAASVSRESVEHNTISNETSPQDEDNETEKTTREDRAEPGTSKEDDESIEVDNTPKAQRHKLRGRRSLHCVMNDSKNITSPNGSRSTNTTNETISFTELPSAQFTLSSFSLQDSSFDSNCSGVAKGDIDVKEECEKSTIEQEVVSSTAVEMETDKVSKKDLSAYLTPERPSVKQQNLSMNDTTNATPIKDYDISPYTWSSYNETFATTSLSFPESLFESSASDSSISNINQGTACVMIQEDGQENKVVEAETENNITSNIPLVNLDTVQKSQYETAIPSIQNLEKDHVLVKEKATDETTESSKEIFEECIDSNEEFIPKETENIFEETVEEARFLNEFEMNVEFSEVCNVTTELSSQHPQDVEAGDDDIVIQPEEITSNKSQKGSPQPEPDDNEAELQLEESNHSVSVSPEKSDVMEKGFVLSPQNIIEIVDSSETSSDSSSSEDLGELNTAIIEMIESDETSTNESYSEDSQESLSEHASEEYQCEDDAQVLEEEEENNIRPQVSYEDTEETEMEVCDDNTEIVSAELTDQPNLEDCVQIKPEVKDIEIQVSMLVEEHTVEEDALVTEEDTVIMEQEVDVEVDHFLTILVTNPQEDLVIDLPEEKNQSLQILKDDGLTSNLGKIYDDIEGKELVGDNLTLTAVSKKLTLKKHIAVQEEVTLSKPSTSLALLKKNNENLKKEQIRETSEDVKNTENIEMADKDVKKELVLETLSEIKAEVYLMQSSEIKQVVDASKEKILQPVVDVMQLKTPIKTLVRRLSVNEVTPTKGTKNETSRDVNRTLRSVSADPETPRRKSRRLSGVGLLEDDAEIISSPTVLTRSSSKVLSSSNTEPIVNSPVQRTKRFASTSDCTTDSLQQEVKTPDKRVRRSTSVSTLTSISEENNPLKVEEGSRKSKRSVQQEISTEIMLKKNVNVEKEEEASNEKDKSKFTKKEEDEKQRKSKRRTTSQGSEKITNEIAKQGQSKIPDVQEDEDKKPEIINSVEKHKEIAKEVMESGGKGANQTAHQEEHEEEKNKSINRGRKLKKPAKEEGIIKDEQPIDKDKKVIEHEKASKSKKKIPKTSPEAETVDYTTSRRVTRTQKSILTKMQSIQPETIEDVHIETTPPRAEAGPSSSRMKTRSQSTDSISSVSSSTHQDVGRLTPNSLRRKPSEESLASISSISMSPSTSRKRLRTVSQRSEAGSEVGNESPVTSLRRSTRSRSKTPDIPEKSTRTVKRGSLEQIPEEPEKPVDEPKIKKGRPRKANAT